MKQNSSSDIKMFKFIKPIFVSTIMYFGCLSSVNLVSRTNETRHIKLHEMCKCTCRLDTSICNNKERWNEDKCMCECKELIDKGECECDKSCDISECLDYSNCKCR